MSNPVKRRSIIKTVAWGAPVISIGAVLPQAAASEPTTPPPAGLLDLWSPYIAAGSVYTRDVSDMPVALNSLGIVAAILAAIPSTLIPNGQGIRTSFNIGVGGTPGTIPVFVVDSTDPKQTYAQMLVNGPLSGEGSLSKTWHQVMNGTIPLPSYAYAAGGSPSNPNGSQDRSFSVYDQGNGLMRDYFFCEKQADGSWTASFGGYYQAKPGFKGLGSDNYSMRLSEGTSAVVGMLTPLMEVGISEARKGVINHALGVVLPNAPLGISSWPAKQGDGTLVGDLLAPAEGQWFRIDPKVDLASLGLRPFTLLLATAVQTYGAMGVDKNVFDFAFNAQDGGPEQVATGKNPWLTDIHDQYLGPDNNPYRVFDVTDFPWAHVQFAVLDWGKP